MKDREWQRIRRRVVLRPCGAAGPFDVFDGDYDGRGLCTPTHRHDWDSLHLVLAGRVSETYGDMRRTAGPGSLLLYRAGTPHRTRVTGRARIIHLPLKAREPRLPGPGTWAPQPESDVYARVLHLVAFLVAGVGDAAARADREGDRLVESIERESERERRDRRAVTAALRVSGSPTTPSLEELATACGTSRGHLIRLFRRAHGCSVGQMIKRRQVATVVRLLLGGDRPLAEIAQHAGFCDQSHMTRVFRDRVGLTPLRFRSSFAG